FRPVCGPACSRGMTVVIRSVMARTWLWLWYPTPHATVKIAGLPAPWQQNAAPVHRADRDDGGHGSLSACIKHQARLSAPTGQELGVTFHVGHAMPDCHRWRASHRAYRRWPACGDILHGVSSLSAPFTLAMNTRRDRRPNRAIR